MLVLGRDKLRAFVEIHPDAEAWISSWLSEAEKSAWKQPKDVKDRYGTADFLGEGRVVFNIRGNRYRLVVVIHYLEPAMALVRWVGTHAEYDKVDAKAV